MDRRQASLPDDLLGNPLSPHVPMGKTRKSMSVNYRIRHLQESDPALTLVACEDEGIVRLSGILFGIRNTFNEYTCTATDSPTVHSWAERLASYLYGVSDDFKDVSLDFRGFTEFRRSVTESARSIPYGKTVSYGGLAEMSGKAKAVRAAAGVMRQNPWPIVVPCHRVIAGDGSIGGYCGAVSGKWVHLKKRLLTLEEASNQGSCWKQRQKRTK